MKPQRAYKSVGTHYTTIKKGENNMRVLGCGFFLISKAYMHI